MSEATLGALAWALVIIVVWGFIEWRSRARARQNLSREIMNRELDETAMHAAIAAGAGDRDASRRHYLRGRLSTHRRGHRRSYGKRIGKGIATLIMGYMFVYVVINTAYEAYTGDLFWWWDGAAVSRETVIGLLWVVTLVLVPYITYSLAARRRVSRARATGEVLGATVTAFVCLFLFSTAIAKMLV